MPYFCFQEQFFLSGEIAAGFSARVAFQLKGKGRIVPEKLWPGIGRRVL